MKKTILLVVFAASLGLALPAYAVDEHHPDEPAAKTQVQTVQSMQDNVKKMQAQLDRIAGAKTDEERRQALAEHMQTMQENMMMARGMGMMDCPMMDDGRMGMGMGMMGGMGMGMMGADPGTDRMQQMERRMDMMQMMMERMQKQMDQPAKR